MTTNTARSPHDVALLGERRFCPECRSTRAVEESSGEGHYAFGREVAYRVWHLVCGHSVEGGRLDVGPAPGAAPVRVPAWRLPDEDPWL